MNPQSPNIFQWTPFKGVLEDDQQEYIPFHLSQQEIQISQNIHLPNITFKPSFRKQLNFEVETGWSWHKSWNLPDLEIQTEGQNIQLSKLEGHISVQIFVGKILKQPNIYKSIGIQGESKKTFLDNRVLLRCLKFTTTSYNNNHQKFFLIAVFLYNSVNGQNIPINALISPEIFVDSRKFARFTNLTPHQQNLANLFSPDLLHQQIIKREIKNKSVNQIEIDNSIQGFIHYYTASNIRNKIKHPLFLALKFSNLIKLFVDISLTQQQDFIANLQKNLQDNINNIEQNKQIKLLIMPQHEENQIQRKAIEIIQSLENNGYEIYTQKCYLPNNVTEIDDIQQLNYQYISYYSTKQNQLYTQNNFNLFQQKICKNNKEDNLKDMTTQTDINLSNLQSNLISTNQSFQQTHRILDNIQHSKIPSVKIEIQDQLIKKVKQEDQFNEKQRQFQQAVINNNYIQNQSLNQNYLNYCMMQNYQLPQSFQQQYFHIYQQQQNQQQYQYYYRM